MYTQKRGRTDRQTRHTGRLAECWQYELLYIFLFVVYLTTFVNNSDYIESNNRWRQAWLNLKEGILSAVFSGQTVENHKTLSTCV
jgi:hypothetical protein